MINITEELPAACSLEGLEGVDLAVAGLEAHSAGEEAHSAGEDLVQDGKFQIFLDNQIFLFIATTIMAIFIQLTYIYHILHVHYF